MFNLRWGAPDGRPGAGFIPRRYRASRIVAPIAGCFAFQVNNTTRAFEYPWAYEALQLRRGMRVLEIGGSLAGFQFVLDKVGCEVTNVDPGDDFFTGGWSVTPATMDRLNAVLGTNVELKACYLDAAGLASESFDRAVSISVFEHVPDAALPALVQEVRRVLRPGGLLVLTTDLFLNVRPFASAERNEYGLNVSMKRMIEASGLELIHGDRGELHGYPQFDHRAIMARRSEYLVGRYPAMVQTVVLRKP